MATRILVPVNGSDTTARTIAAIVAEKERFGGPLTLLHVVDADKLAYRMIPDFQVEMIRESARKAGEQLLVRLQRTLAEAGLSAETRLELGPPRQVVCQIANEEGYQLVILGRRGTGEIRDVLFGTLTNYALHKVRCPVLLF